MSGYLKQDPLTPAEHTGTLTPGCLFSRHASPVLWPTGGRDSCRAEKSIRRMAMAAQRELRPPAERHTQTEFERATGRSPHPSTGGRDSCRAEKSIRRKGWRLSGSFALPPSNGCLSGPPAGAECVLSAIMNAPTRTYTHPRRFDMSIVHNVK